MAKHQMIIELRYNRDLAAVAFAAGPEADKQLDTGSVPKISGVKYDEDAPPCALPQVTPRDPSATPFVSGEAFNLSFEPKDETYIVRAEVDDKALDELMGHKQVAGVFADVAIEPTMICPGSPPLGNTADVERLLCVPKLHRLGMDGSGVLVAIVDTGINLAHLRSRGRPISLDAGRSWVPRAGLTPGNAPVGHGTMCAFDAAIAAPRATFLDIQLLRSTATGPTAMSGFLSDAVRAYSHLCNVMNAPRRPGENRSLVVNNSWGMFHPSWDFPVGHAGNYSDNPNHPFNRIVNALAGLGADILFAAGNCGRNCPDGRCQGVTDRSIYGANSHPAVLTIAGVDVQKRRVGYSSIGPGRLSRNKPDLSGFTHFSGSGVYAADGGTSAACPVVAGVVAAVRVRRPFQAGNPASSAASIRALMRSTAEDLGPAGFDFETGYGVVGGCNLARRFERVVIADLCRIHPRLCQNQPAPINLCERYPQLCREVVRLPDRPPIPIPIPRPGPLPPGLAFDVSDEPGSEDLLDAFAGPDSIEALLQSSYEAGLRDGLGLATVHPSTSSPRASTGCDCGAKD